jgi:hypothetical protein
MTSAREEIAKELEELVPSYVSADYLRGVETWLEELIDAHGEHPMLRAAIKKISARIFFLETGQEMEEQKWH